MAETRQKMRGTTAQLDTHVGAEGQLCYDLTREDLRVFDGVTQGGKRIPNADYMYSKTVTDSTFLKQTDAASTYLTQTNAASTYLTQANATSTYTPKTTLIQSGDGLNGGGDLSADRNLSVDGTVLRTNADAQTVNATYMTIKAAATQNAQLRVAKSDGKYWAMQIQDSTNLFRLLYDNGGGAGARFTLDGSGNLTLSGRLDLGTQATGTSHAVRADRLINSGGGLSGGGNLSGDLTLSVDSTVMRNNAAQALQDKLFEVVAQASGEDPKVRLKTSNGKNWEVSHDDDTNELQLVYDDGVTSALLAEFKTNGSLEVNNRVILGAQATIAEHAVRADRTLASGDGLTGGGTLVSDRTLAVDSTVVRTNKGAAQTLDHDLVADRFHATSTGSPDNPALGLMDGATARAGIYWHGATSTMRFSVGTSTPYMRISTSVIEAINGAAFTGDGSGLTTMNATQLTTGTLPDARLSSNVPVMNAGANQTFDNKLTATQFIANVTGNGSASDPALKLDDGTNNGGMFITSSQLRLALNGSTVLRMTATALRGPTNHLVPEFEDEQTATQTDYPVGQIVMVRNTANTSPIPAIRTTVTPYIDSTNDSYLRNNSDGTGAALAGTWINIGRTNWQDTDDTFLMCQRIA